MTRSAAADPLVVRAPAKLNLRLRVLGRRADGYHEIDTHLVRLRLADEVSLETGGEGIRLQVDRATGAAGPSAVPADARNLCWKAAEVFFHATGRDPAVTIHLSKRIPVAAGLGGGSSDAAAVLTGLNRAHGHPLPPAELTRCATRLGSDVAFFASGTAAAVATGRGECVRPVEAPPARPVLIVVPDFGVAAAEAYAWWSEDAGEVRGVDEAGDALEGDEAEALRDWTTLSRRAVNDLAAPVVTRRPELRSALEGLTAAHASPAILCGSGSCVAGLFETEAQRDAARAVLSESRILDPDWRLVPTSTEGPRGL